MEINTFRDTRGSLKKGVHGKCYLKNHPHGLSAHFARSPLPSFKP